MNLLAVMDLLKDPEQLNTLFQPLRDLASGIAAIQEAHTRLAARIDTLEKAILRVEGLVQNLTDEQAKSDAGYEGRLISVTNELVVIHDLVLTIAEKLNDGN